MISIWSFRPFSSNEGNGDSVIRYTLTFVCLKLLRSIKKSSPSLVSVTSKMYFFVLFTGYDLELARFTFHMSVVQTFAILEAISWSVIEGLPATDAGDLLMINTGSL